MFSEMAKPRFEFFSSIVPLVRILETSLAVENEKSGTQAPERWVGVIFFC
jgi:hypothetical protein